jgi:hypothetical protein
MTRDPSPTGWKGQLAHGDPDKIRGPYNKKMMQGWADYLVR